MSAYTEAEDLVVITNAAPRRRDHDEEDQWAYSEWMEALPVVRASTLHQNNRMKLLKLWGAQTCTFTGEYRYWIWRREFEGYEVWVLTGNRGTSIEVPHEMPGRARASFAKTFLGELEA